MQIFIYLHSQFPLNACLPYHEAVKEPRGFNPSSLCCFFCFSLIHMLHLVNCSSVALFGGCLCGETRIPTVLPLCLDRLPPRLRHLVCFLLTPPDVTLSVPPEAVLGVRQSEAPLLSSPASIGSSLSWLATSRSCHITPKCG